MYGGHILYFALYIIMAISSNRRQPSVVSLAFLKSSSYAVDGSKRSLLYSLHLSAIRRPTELPHWVTVYNLRHYERNEKSLRAKA